MANILIADNLIFTDTYHGVAMYYPINVTVVGNTLVSTMDDNKIWIYIVRRRGGEEKEEGKEEGEEGEEGFDFVWARLSGVAEASGCE